MTPFDREAMRLIEANGYANTTIEQIAAAAEVAPSTLFRYLPTKESVLMTNDLDKVADGAPGRDAGDPFGMMDRTRRTLDFMEGV